MTGEKNIVHFVIIQSSINLAVKFHCCKVRIFCFVTIATRISETKQ